MTQSDFELIVRQNQSMVYSIAYHFFHNVATAEEIAQDVFLQLYESKAKLQSDSHVTAWLRRVATHRCIDMARHQKVQNEVELDELPDSPDISYGERDPLLQDRLRKLVASLPSTPRMVVILRYGEDMDIDEIGRILDIPERTVWTHLQRAITLLRQKASGYLREESNERAR